MKQNLRYGQVSFLLDNVLALGSGRGSRGRRVLSMNMSGLVVDNQAIAEFETGNISHQALFLALITLLFGFRCIVIRLTLNPFNPSYGIPISVPTTVTQSYRQKYNQTRALCAGPDQVQRQLDYHFGRAL